MSGRRQWNKVGRTSSVFFKISCGPGVLKRPAHFRRVQVVDRRADLRIGCLKVHDGLAEPFRCAQPLGPGDAQQRGALAGADVTLECSGNQASLVNCIMQVAKNGSQVVMVGIVGEPLNQLVLAPVIPREIDLISSFVYTSEEIAMYLDMLASGKLRFPGMVTDVIALDDVVEQGVARKDRRGQLKILIDPSR